jgi:hypothetical protein
VFQLDPVPSDKKENLPARLILWISRSTVIAAAGRSLIPLRSWVLSMKSIFSGPGDATLTAVLRYPEGSHNMMAEGYLEATKKLVEPIKSEAIGIDFLVYPIVFLYRQWFELRLKYIIDHGRQLLSQGSGYDKVHELDKLWPVTQEIMEQVWAGYPRPAEFELINRAVEDFRRFDADSQGFRYPIDRKGNPNLLGLDEINLGHFASEMDKIARFLDGAASAISVYLDNLRAG